MSRFYPFIIIHEWTVIIVKMPSVSRYISNTFLRGTLLFTVATFLAGLLNYLFNLVVAKKLGPAGFGEISALFSYTTIFSVPMAVITMVIIQKIGSYKNRGVSYALTLHVWLVAQLKKWWLIILPLLFFGPVVQNLTNLSSVSSFSLIPFIILNLAGAYYIAILQGLHQFVWLSAIGVAVVVIKLTGAIVITDASLGVISIITFLFISSFTSVVSSFIALKRQSIGAIVIKSKLNRQVFGSIFQKQVIITFLSVLGLTLLGNADVVTAKRLLLSDQAGLYGAWNLFAKIILYFMGPFIISSYIFFSSKKHKQNHESVLKISLMFIAILSAVSYSLYTMFSLPLIHVLFGTKFEDISFVLGMASLFGSLYAATTFINNYFLSKKSIYSIAPIVAGAVYVPLLYLRGNSITSLITINIITGSLLLLLQIISLVKYNTDNGK